MSVNSDLLKNTQNSFQLFSNKKVLQKGGCNGVGSSVTMTSLNNDASNGMGYSRAAGVPYVHCSQKGGAGYGFDSKAAGSAATFRGMYPAYSSYQKPSQCGGKKRKRKRSRKRSRKRKHKRKSKKKKGGKRRKSRKRRKSKKKKGGVDPNDPRCAPFCHLIRSKRKHKRKSRKKKGGKRRKSRRKRKTGTLTTLGSPQMGGSTVSYNLGASNPQVPWALANNSYGLNEKSCFDNYNHFKKN